MKNSTKIALLAMGLSTALCAEAFASRMDLVNKTKNPKVYVFVRGVNSNQKPNTYTITGESQSFDITPELVDNKQIFEITASTSPSGDPDWKLFAGTCTDLFIDKNYKLLIDSTLGKLSCTHEEM